MSLPSSLSGDAQPSGRYATREWRTSAGRYRFLKMVRQECRRIAVLEPVELDQHMATALHNSILAMDLSSEADVRQTVWRAAQRVAASSKARAYYDARIEAHRQRPPSLLADIPVSDRGEKQEGGDRPEPRNPYPFLSAYNEARTRYRDAGATPPLRPHTF